MTDNSFTVKVEDLLPDTDYYYYAFVVVDGGKVTSGFANFHTSEDSTLNITEIGAMADETEETFKALLTRTAGF